jgi:hypothetical protein
MPTEIRGVDTNPKGSEPRQMGRMEGPGLAAPEVIRPSRYGNGEDRHGTPAGAEHRTAKTQRYRDGEAHRAGLRSQPYPKR